MTSIHILADDRECQSLVIDALRDHNGVEVTLVRLELGDYLLNQRLLIERKTMLINYWSNSAAWKRCSPPTGKHCKLSRA